MLKYAAIPLTQSTVAAAGLGLIMIILCDLLHIQCNCNPNENFCVIVIIIIIIIMLCNQQTCTLYMNILCEKISMAESCLY